MSASACSTDSGALRSHTTLVARTPISRAAFASASALRATRTTRAPSPCKARAHSKPMPRDAPETTADRPRSGTAPPPLAAVVLDIVVDRLPQHEARELRRPQRGLEHAPEGDDHVLRGRDRPAEKIDLEVEIAV